MLTGCLFAPKVMRLENQLLQRENAELRDQLKECSTQSVSSDYVTEVTMVDVVAFLQRSGFTEVQPVSESLVSVPYVGENTDFRVNVQLFKREQVLFLVAVGYMELEAASSSSNMVLLLTQLAAMNYNMLIGKFQLNPTTGAITLSAEINLDDGMGFQTFNSVLSHLVNTADTQHPALLSAAQGLGL